MLSSELPLFGSGLTFLPSAGLSLGQCGANSPCKRIRWGVEEVWRWRWEGSHGNGGGSGLFRAAMWSPC